MWISLLKILYITIKYIFCSLPIIRNCIHIIFITNLYNNFIKRLFLFACTNFFIIIIYHSVISFLPFIIFFQCIIKQFMVYCFYIFIIIGNIIFTTFFVYIFSSKFTFVMMDRAFPKHNANCSFHKLKSPHFLFYFVTFVKSNANALLTVPIKSTYCVLPKTAFLPLIFID